MKNQQILKDELILLSADRSAVLTELRKRSDELKSLQKKIELAEQELANVQTDIKLETARLDDARGRVVLVSAELEKCSVEIQDARATAENVKAKNAQESKAHLGRIKELNEKIEKLTAKADETREVYDRNATLLSFKISELNRKYRETEKALVALRKERDDITARLESMKEKEHKATKDRLKKEDKLRVREKMAEKRESALDKKEETLAVMQTDMMIVYNRLKELYAQVDPSIDLDKLITQP